MNGPLRRLASLTLWIAARLLPSRMSSWACAMRRELAEIADHGAALAFALGCLRAALTLAITERLEAAGAPLSAHSIGRDKNMNGILARPRLLGLICGSASVGLGLAYMVMAGAPFRYLLVNLVALVLGSATWFALGRLAGSRLGSAGPFVLILAMSLLLTALFGVAADGATRWVRVGPLALQVSLVVVPLMLVLYARRPDAAGTAGMIVAALALAVQPDRAMAGVLLAGLLAAAFAMRARGTMMAIAAAVLAFASTLLTPEALPAVPFVDGVLWGAFRVHPLAGVGVVAGVVALLVPALAALITGAGERSAILAFAGCWLAVVIAAAVGNYPTPLVGYGGSAVLGYLLSVALLSGGASESSPGQVFDEEPAEGLGPAWADMDLRVAG